MAFRNSTKDRIKSANVIKEQYGKLCCVAGCNQPLTMYQGPGQDLYCRDHQLELVDYGGYGKSDRPHTFHRSDVCTCCGQDINNDPRWEKAQEFFGVVLTDKQKHEIKRRYNHGDHEHRKADGGDDSAENISALCSFCHWVKTVVHNDGRRPESTQQ